MMAERRLGMLPLDAKALANLLLDWADADAVPISPMKLQKLLFFCHADYLAQFGQPLLKQAFEAWDYGPVIPCLYSEFKAAGSSPISTRAMTFDPVTAKRSLVYYKLPENEELRLHTLYSFYRHITAEKLSDLSHARGGPWRYARSMFANGLNMGRRITDDMILRFHQFPHT